jgi:hypothetical protein
MKDHALKQVEFDPDYATTSTSLAWFPADKTAVRCRTMCDLVQGCYRTWRQGGQRDASCDEGYLGESGADILEHLLSDRVL